MIRVCSPEIRRLQVRFPSGAQKQFSELQFNLSSRQFIIYKRIENDAEIILSIYNQYIEIDSAFVYDKKHCIYNLDFRD